MKILITGKTGVGKSSILTKTKLDFYNMDEVVKNIFYAPNHPLTLAFLEKFGNKILKKDGSVDTSFLGKSLFSKEIKWSEIDTLVEPYVKKYIQDNDGVFEMAGYMNNEKKYKRLFNKIILIEGTQRVKDKFKFSDDKPKDLINNTVKYNYLIVNENIEESAELLTTIIKEIDHR